MSLASAARIEDARSGRVGRVLPGPHGVEPLFDKLLAGSRDGREAGLQRLCDLIVAPALNSVIAMSELNSCDRDIGAELL